MPANANNSLAKRSSLLSEVTIDMVANNKRLGGANKGFSRIARLVGSGSGNFPTSVSSEDRAPDTKEE
jgi:hypothetical protein